MWCTSCEFMWTTFCDVPLVNVCGWRYVVFHFWRSAYDVSWPTSCECRRLTFADVPHEEFFG